MFEDTFNMQYATEFREYLQNIITTMAQIQWKVKIKSNTMSTLIQYVTSQGIVPLINQK